MRFHFVMLLIVILVSLGMHSMASAGVSSSRAAEGSSLQQPASPGTA